MWVLIVAIIFSYAAFEAFLKYNSRKDKEKIDAALRIEEMRRGYPPGTYSSYSSKKDKKKKRRNKDNDFVPEFKENSAFSNNRNKERADLKEGIDDLMTRISNLEVIMESEKNKGENL